MQKTILPPQCLGILGGGQLGRMLAISAKQMGYKIAVLEPDPNCPAKQFADYYISSQYDDKAGLDKLAKLAAIVTTEFENVPAESLAYLAQFIPVYPSHSAILIAQNRLQEKQFFNQSGIKTTRYYAISSSIDIKNVPSEIFPAILKTNTLGYDGKGQVRVNNLQQLSHAFGQLNQVPCILEQMIDLKLEVSLIVARNSREVISYPVGENVHHNGILDVTIVPARINEELSQQIRQAGITLIEKLNYIGVLAIEFFITKDGKILANEMAPRPHNSGHYTLDACSTSQFEQQVRSICNLKLGSTNLTSNAIMLNLMGEIWLDATTHPAWGNILSHYTNAKLHLYEKQLAKPGRKMGHLTLLGNELTALAEQVREIKLQVGIANP